VRLVKSAKSCGRRAHLEKLAVREGGHASVSVFSRSRPNGPLSSHTTLSAATSGGGAPSIVAAGQGRRTHRSRPRHRMPMPLNSRNEAVPIGCGFDPAICAKSAAYNAHIEILRWIFTYHQPHEWLPEMAQHALMYGSKETLQWIKENIPPEFVRDSFGCRATAHGTRREYQHRARGPCAGQLTHRLRCCSPPPAVVADRAGDVNAAPRAAGPHAEHRQCLRA